MRPFSSPRLQDEARVMSPDSARLPTAWARPVLGSATLTRKLSRASHRRADERNKCHLLCTAAPAFVLLLVRTAKLERGLARSERKDRRELPLGVALLPSRAGSRH